jgi:hypothetical protein
MWKKMRHATEESEEVKQQQQKREEKTGLQNKHTQREKAKKEVDCNGKKLILL